MPGPNLGPDYDLAKRIKNLEDAVRGLSTRDVLQNASIGAGGITVNGGTINVTSGGSIVVTGGGSIQLPTGTFTAGTVHATSTLQVDGTANVSGDITGSGAVNLANNTVISSYARNHQVSTNYVAAYINSDGSILATASSGLLKRDVETLTWTRAQREAIRIVSYRLRAAWILADMQGHDTSLVQRLPGIIGEELLAIGGFEDFVVMDQEHPDRVFTVHNELMWTVVLDGLQQAERHQDAQDAEIRDLKTQVAALARRLDAAGID